MKTIYLDNAATTQTYPEVLDAMLPFFTEHYGNPSSIYSFAGEAGKAVDEARRTIASAIGADASEIYFTGGQPLPSKSLVMVSKLEPIR